MPDLRQQPHRHDLQLPYQYAAVHTFRRYDVDVDTSVATSQQCAEVIFALLDARSSDG
jgi:chloramphenicol 3-O-phosphotransferase